MLTERSGAALKDEGGVLGLMPERQSEDARQAVRGAPGPSSLPALDRRFLIMHNLAVYLRVLCELVLLDAMGFSRDEVRERMKSTQRLERHLVNPASEG
jgi:hypothetical protein